MFHYEINTIQERQKGHSVKSYEFLKVLTILSSSKTVNLGLAPGSSLLHSKFILASRLGIFGFLERKGKGTATITITCHIVKHSSVAHYFDRRYTAYSTLRTVIVQPQGSFFGLKKKGG